MTGKEFKEKKAKIQELRACAQFDHAQSLTFVLINELFRDYKFSRIVELFYSQLCEPKETFYTFEVAYALSEMNCIDEAERIYEHLLLHEANNPVILNNLSHIKKVRNQLPQAFDLIRKAFEICPQDEVIVSNYHQLYSVIQEQEELHQLFTKALDYLADENDFITEKLKIFLYNAYQEPNFENNRIAIPEWKFGVLLETDQPQADFLTAQWLEKGYLRDTGDRDPHLVPIYEINPFLEKELEHIQRKQVPQKWLDGIPRLTMESLEQYSYFSIINKIRKIEKKYRNIIERDFTELFLNYLVKNEKAVVVLSGSLVEMVLVYYCEEKKNLKEFHYHKQGKAFKREIYECDLADILNFFQEKKILGDVIVHAGNIARIYRNFIHPGKELRDQEFLTQSKLDLCFFSTLEIINTVLE